MLNKKVEDALNAQINAELWSAYLYLSMSAYCHSVGQPGMANWFEIQFSKIMQKFCSTTSIHVAVV